MTQLIVYLVAAMVAWVPPVYRGDAQRYEAIAKDVLAVAYDADVQPVFDGPRGRAKTALELMAIASFESQFRADVDDGRVRGKLGEVCILQVLLPGDGRGIVVHDGVYEDGSYEYERGGWSYFDLTRDRTKCVRAALAKVRESYKLCRNLSLYTSGTCNADEPKAKARHGRAVGWWRHAPAPIEDVNVL